MRKSKRLSKVNCITYHDELQNITLSILPPPPKKKKKKIKKSIPIQRIIILVTSVHCLVIYPEDLPFVMDYASQTCMESVTVCIKKQSGDLL